MQDLLQGLQNAREIVASGPVVMEELQRMLLSAETQLERMMILRNVQLRISRPAPNSNRRGRQPVLNFEGYRPIRSKSNYV